MKKSFPQRNNLGLFSILAFVIDFGLLILFKELVGLNYLLCSAISFTVAVVFYWICGVFLVFDWSQEYKFTKKKCISLIFCVIGLAVNQLLMWLLVDGLGIPYLAAKLITAIVVIIYFLVFRQFYLDTGIFSEQTEHRINCVLRFLLFIVLLLISFLAIIIQTTVVDIASLPAVQNKAPKFVILIDAFYSTLGTVEPVHLIAIVAIAWLYRRAFFRQNATFSLTALITGGLFSFFLLLGMSFKNYGDFSFMIGSRYQIGIACIVFLGYWAILYALIRELIQVLDNFRLKPSRLHTSFLSFIDRHLFWFGFAMILLCWLPLWISHFPSSVSYDGWFQLDQYFGIYDLTSHHPVASTLLMGSIVQLGNIILGADYGIALYVIFQSVVCAVIYSNICVYLRRKNMPLSFAIGGILFFSVVPVWGMFAQLTSKDAIYAGLFAWFMLEYVKCFLGDGGKYGTVQLGLTAVLVCLFRNDGIMIVAPALLVLLFLVKTKWRKVLITLVVTLAVVIGCNNFLLRALDISSDSTQESMSIPFSQIARFVQNYGDELTEDEVQVIDAILDYNSIAENYDPERSDSVKNTYRNDATDEDWSAFWKLWEEKLTEHPLVYAEATMNQIYGYLDPFYEPMGSEYFFIEGKISSNEEEPIYSTYVFSESVRNAVSEYAYAWQKIPGLNFLSSCGGYTWAVILLFALILRRKDWRSAWVFLIPLLNLLICFLSPVNGYLRYMLPIMSSMPLYIFLGLRKYIQPPQIKCETNKVNYPAL